MTVRYFVTDLERSLEFYKSNLGFHEVERFGPVFARIALGDLELWLSGPETSAARPMPDGRKPEPGGWNRIVVSVPNVDEKVAELRAAGVSFRNERLSGPGGTQVLIEDPDGNPIEIFSPRG